MFCRVAAGECDRSSGARCAGAPRFGAYAAPMASPGSSSSALCDTPRSAADFIEIARSFHTVLLANVPILGAHEDDDKAQRFIQLVDELYDHNVNLIVSADGQPAELYRSGRLGRQFQRTRSRLEEMQSRAYLARLHLA